MRSAGKTVHLGGNIGHPLLAETPSIQPEDVAVLELSSFQLMTMGRSPHIAVITNLSPNHLDVHKDFAEYITAKENIFTHQNAQDIAVFNADNSITAQQAERALGRARLFSRKSEHNVENYLAAIAAVDGMVSDDRIAAFARSFGGVEHRIELIRTLDGVRWYNDSIASSPSRTIAGLRAFPEKVILIAGGKDKGISYAELGPVVNDHVKLLLLCGATAGVIRESVEQAENYQGLEIIDVADYHQAAQIARERAVEGDVVILSPASTSFDRFKNFMERGKAFKEVVNGLQ